MTTQKIDQETKARIPELEPVVLQFPSDIAIDCSHEDLQRSLQEVHRRSSVQLDADICSECDSLRQESYVEKSLLGLRKVHCKKLYCDREGCVTVIGRICGSIIAMGKGIPDNCEHKDEYLARERYRDAVENAGK